MRRSTRACLPPLGPPSWSSWRWHLRPWACWPCPSSTPAALCRQGAGFEAGPPALPAHHANAQSTARSVGRSCRPVNLPAGTGRVQESCVRVLLPPSQSSCTLVRTGTSSLCWVPTAVLSAQPPHPRRCASWRRGSMCSRRRGASSSRCRHWARWQSSSSQASGEGAGCCAAAHGAGLREESRHARCARRLAVHRWPGNAPPACCSFGPAWHVAGALQYQLSPSLTSASHLRPLPRAPAAQGPPWRRCSRCQHARASC